MIYLIMVLGIQDAALMAENMVIAAESLGLGSCFLGGWPFSAKTLQKKYQDPPAGFSIGRPDHGLSGGRSPCPSTLSAGISFI